MGAKVVDDVDVVDVLVVVVVATFPRRAAAARQTSERPDFVQLKTTFLTVREVPTLAHFVPRMSGTNLALAAIPS